MMRLSPHGFCRFTVAILGLAAILALAPATGQVPQPNAGGTRVVKPSQLVGGMLDRLAAIVEPAPDAPAGAFIATVRLARSDGLPEELAGATAEIAFQAPDRARLDLHAGGKQPFSLTICRDGQRIWIHAPDKKFGVIGKPGLVRFAADPQSIDTTIMGPVRLPVPIAQIKIPLLLASMDHLGQEKIDNADCDVIRVSVPDQLSAMLKLPPARVEVAIRQRDQLPARLRIANGKSTIEIRLENPRLIDPLPADRWTVRPGPEDVIESVAVSHLIKCFEAAISLLDRQWPTLGEVRGVRTLVATSGQGRREMHDGTRVLFLRGTPEQMGQQQGQLVRREARALVERVLYGAGVGSSFVKGRWFFGEIEQAQKRLSPFISERVYREIDALADAAGVHRQEARLANVFPELFHCSGFAIGGEATVDGRLYHGRVLDYLRGVGLEQSAVVTVYQPDQGFAWVNCGYAGFVGSVTAMNHKGISIGEMGGGGQGQWDGKPMAQIIREVMEQASTLDQAVEIMRKGPRTCQYFYVIADGKSGKAVGIAATPDKFEVLRQGEAHPKLPSAIKDCVLLSAGQRYEKLVERVKAGHGRFDEASARALMERPVCMNSNIQSVLFAPATLDFWVANADAKNVASHTRYTHYNLAELLESTPAPRPRNIVDRLRDLAR